MKTGNFHSFIVPALLCLSVMAACMNEKKVKDRSGAAEMYGRIIELTQVYIDRMQSAPDSADWNALGKEFEESLDKINFSYPPDTDLLLTEGQNDTIQAMLEEYIAVRDSRIHAILHPVVESDTIPADSVVSAGESLNQ